MNKKGQSLILFVFLMPILIMAFAYIFDSALIINSNIKLKNIGENAIKYALNEKLDKNKIIEYIKENDKNITIIELTINDSDATIHIQRIIDSLFGKIIGFDNYEINARYIGYIENGEVIIREKG